MAAPNKKLSGKRSLNLANERAIAKRLRLEVLRDLTDRLSDLDSDNPDSEDEHQAGSITESVNNLDDVSGSNESDSDREHVNFNDALQVGDNVNDDAEPSEHSELDESFEERPPSPPQEANNNDGDSLEYLTKFLAGWARRGVSFKKVDELLAGLNVLYPMLTKCHKVLLRCDTIRNFEVVGEGELWYKGFSANLNQRLTPEYLNKHREIVIDINMDGLDLHESSKLKFWPILGCLKGQRTPFIVGCYCGESHPDIEGYLKSFVEDANHLQDNGFLAFGRNYEVKIRHFILDAPARALVKCCAGHSSKAACEKCDVVGYSKYSRIVFVGVNGDLRTDESFSNREQPSHHKGMSPLERDLNVKMVSQFRLDVLHLVHGGVFKRWLLYLIGDLHRKETAEELHVRKYNRDNGIAQERFKPRGKVTAASKNAISDAIFNIAPSMPHDFSRRPRPLQYIHQYKCTEYTRLLLYDGIRVFKGNIPSNAYRNFLLLHTGLYILSSPTFVKEDVWLNVAREVLDRFVSTSVNVFDDSFCVYNVHTLKHLVDECAEHGEADSFSAYKFENYLGSIRKCLRSQYLPLQQLANRDAECDGWILQKTREESRYLLTICAYLFLVHTDPLITKGSKQNRSSARVLHRTAYLSEIRAGDSQISMDVSRR